MEVAVTSSMSLYGYCERGFYRMSFFGWRLVLIDTKKHRAMFSDRTLGWHIGRFIVRASRYGAFSRA